MWEKDRFGNQDYQLDCQTFGAHFHFFRFFLSSAEYFFCVRKMDVAIRVTKDASPANILIALTDPIRLAYL